MAYTDLWRCKRCHELPEIQHLSGRHFLIECKTCKSAATTVEAETIDRVVHDWNRRNDPTRRGLGGLLRGVVGKLARRSD
jgi:hypothetical protein